MWLAHQDRGTQLPSWLQSSRHAVLLGHPARGVVLQVARPAFLQQRDVRGKGTEQRPLAAPIRVRLVSPWLPERQIPTDDSYNTVHIDEPSSHELGSQPAVIRAPESAFSARPPVTGVIVAGTPVPCAAGCDRFHDESDADGSSTRRYERRRCACERTPTRVPGR